MIATSKDLVNLSWTQLSNVLELRFGLEVAMAKTKLAILTVSARVEVAYLGEYEGVVPSRSDGNDGLR